MYKSEFCDVDYLDNLNVVFVKWKKFCYSEDYRKPLREAVKIMAEHDDCHYVADTRSGFEDTKEDTEWVLSEFNETAYKAGCKYILFIIDENNSLKKELEGQATGFKKYFEVKAFYCLDEIEEFLKSVREYNG